MIRDYWLCRANDAFQVRGEEASWLGYVGIYLIEWLRDAGSENCMYCGGRNKDAALKCVHCGAALNGTPGAEVQMFVKLPMGKDALHLSKNDVIELLHKECGPRDAYFEDEVFLRLTIRSVERKAFCDPVIYDPSDDAEFGIHLLLRCEMKFLGALSEN